MNSVNPTSDVKIESFDFGVGIWLAHIPKFPIGTTADLSGDSDETTLPTGNELTVFGGFSVENALTGEHRYAWAVEYRKGFWPYVDASLSYFDETNLQITRKRGIGTQLWARNAFVHNRYTIGVGAGVYTAVGSRQQFGTAQYFTPIVAPFFSQTVSYNFNEHADIRITWNRVTGYSAADADVVFFGLGFRWR